MQWPSELTEWRGGCFPATVCPFSLWQHRLSQPPNPATPGDKSAKGAKASRNGSARPIISLKAYAPPPKMLVSNLGVNLGGHCNMWYGPQSEEGRLPIDPPSSGPQGLHPTSPPMPRCYSAPFSHISTLRSLATPPWITRFCGQPPNWRKYQVATPWPINATLPDCVCRMLPAPPHGAMEKHASGA